MTVYLAQKDGEVVSISDLPALGELYGISKPDRTVSVGEWEAAGGTAHVDSNGEIALGEPKGVADQREQLAVLTTEEAALQRELDLTDWKVIRASERGEILADIDTFLHKRREWCRIRISEIRVLLGTLTAP